MLRFYLFILYIVIIMSLNLIFSFLSIYLFFIGPFWKPLLWKRTLSKNYYYKPNFSDSGCSSWHILSKTKSSTPQFFLFYISAITKLSSYSGTVLGKNSMSNVLKVSVLKLWRRTHSRNIWLQLVILLNPLPVLVALKILREILSFTRSFVINTRPLVGCLENFDRKVKQFRVYRGLLQVVLFTVRRYSVQ